MAKIFISHSSQDKAEAVQLMQWLESKGFESLFLDSDARHGIKPGSDWEKTLYREIRRSDAFLFLLSDKWISSQWCGFEFMAARMLGKSIFPLRIQAGLETTIASDLQHLDLSKDREDALQRLHAELTELTLNIQQRFTWDKERPPYPGMLAFEAEDAPVFFGRDAEISRLRERLNQLRTQGGDSLLAMLAASGAGKSSLLKAGLLPRLRRDARYWIVLEALRPEQEPLRKLAQVLATACGAPADAETLYPQLQGEQALDTLRERLQQLRTRSAQWEATVLLSIDQAEELFSTAKPAETTQLLQLLTQAQAERLPLLTLMAMRGDYLEALQAAANKPTFGLYTLDPLPLERISDLIRGPAAVVGLDVEDGLITAATKDAATADALPLLAFALRELYERFGTEGDLTLDEYRRLGSDTLSPLENAVQYKASEAIQPDRLSTEELQALRDAFIPHMVRVNDAGDYVRQPAFWGDLPAQAQPLLDQLTNARLLVQRSDNGAKRVEVAHEALLRHWRLLNGWLREEHDFLLGKQQLEHSLRDWQQLPEPQRAKGLLQGIALERAWEWLLTNRSGLSAAEHSYIQHSHQAEETKRTAEEQRRKKAKQRLTGVSIILAVVVVLLAWQISRVQKEQQRTEISLDEANKLISFINLDLRDKLEPIGQLGIAHDIQEHVAIYCESLGDTIRDESLLRGCAVNLDQLGNTLVGQGDLQKAAKLYDEAVKFFQRRVNRSPENMDYQFDLSVGLEHLGRLRIKQGELDKALKVFEQSFGVAQQLSEKFPNVVDLQRDLSLSLVTISDVLFRQGKPTKALDKLKESQNITQRLVNENPARADFKDNLSVVLNNIGDILVSQNNWNDAQTFFEQSLDIKQNLVNDYPNKTSYEQGLCHGLVRIGRIFLLHENSEKAKTMFEKSRNIWQKLVEQDPSNMDYLAGLSISLAEIGESLYMQKKLEESKAKFHESITIQQKLVYKYPKNIEWKTVLVVAYDALISIARDQDDSEEERKYLKESLIALEPLEKEGLLNAFLQGWPEDMRERLKELE